MNKYDEDVASLKVNNNDKGVGTLEVNVSDEDVALLESSNNDKGVDTLEVKDNDKDLDIDSVFLKFHNLPITERCVVVYTMHWRKAVLYAFIISNRCRRWTSCASFGGS